MATYKDFSGSSSYYDEILNRLKSGDARIKTTAQSTGRVVQDEYGQYVWFPDQGQPGSPELVPVNELSKYYNPVTERYESTKQVTVNPYIDLGNKPVAGMTEWPVQNLGNGKYQLSVMNSGESGYSNVVLNADSTGKVNLTENTPAFFQPYNSGNFFSDFTGAAADLATSDAGKMLMLAAGAGVLPGVSPIVAGSEAAAGLTGVDAALADLAASTPAFTGAEVAGLTGVDAALADLAASTPAFTPEVLVPELVGVDAAMADLAASAAPEFIAPTVAAGAGLTFKEGLDAVRAGLLVNALTGDPLGLGGDTGGGGATAPSGFAQVPIPESWKSPEYTYTPVQNVSFEDLFPEVSLQGTQWQNMPQAQTFNQLFAAGQQQTPMGTPVNINKIVGSILGQSTTG